MAYSTCHLGQDINDMAHGAWHMAHVPWERLTVMPFCVISNALLRSGPYPRTDCLLLYLRRCACPDCRCLISPQIEVHRRFWVRERASPLSLPPSRYFKTLMLPPQSLAE
jgi:hypothetical protein